MIVGIAGRLEEEGHGKDEERDNDTREREESEAAATTAINEEDANNGTGCVHSRDNQGEEECKLVGSKAGHLNNCWAVIHHCVYSSELLKCLSNIKPRKIKDELLLID